LSRYKSLKVELENVSFQHVNRTRIAQGPVAKARPSLPDEVQRRRSQRQAPKAQIACTTAVKCSERHYACPARSSSETTHPHPPTSYTQRKGACIHTHNRLQSKRRGDNTEHGSEWWVNLTPTPCCHGNRVTNQPPSSAASPMSLSETPC